MLQQISELQLLRHSVKSRWLLPVPLALCYGWRLLQCLLIPAGQSAFADFQCRPGGVCH